MSDDFSAHVTMNTALTRLDALLQTAVVSRTTVIQPADASDGDLYILPQEAEGVAWAGRAAGALMRFERGGWTVVTAPDGMIAGVLDEGVVVVRADEGWITLGQRLGEVQALTRLGLGTTADEANPPGGQDQRRPVHGARRGGRRRRRPAPDAEQDDGGRCPIAVV